MTPFVDIDLVLISPYSAGLWAAVTPLLSGVCRVHVLDIGDGETMSALADNVLKKAPPRFVLGGICLGGHVGFEIQRRAPDRLQGLALVNASASADSAGQREMRRLRMEKLEAKVAVLDYPDQAYVDQAAQWLVSPYARDMDAVIEIAKRLVAEVPVRRYLAQQKAMSGRVDSRKDLAATSIPVLIVAGREDRTCPPESVTDIESGAGDTERHVFEHCGHLSPVEQPAQLVLRLVDWLARSQTAYRREKKEIAWTL